MFPDEGPATAGLILLAAAAAFVFMVLFLS